MTSEDTIVLDPWNSKNHLLTKDDVYGIFDRVGFKDARNHITINNLLSILAIYRNHHG